MTRQVFQDLVADPQIATPAALTATTEEALFPAAQYSAIPANDARPAKIYKLTAGGIITTAGSGTLIITPRWGTTTSGITMGANAAQTVPISLSNMPWFLEFYCVIRTIGAAGANGTCIGTGTFGSNAAATAGAAFVVAFGGTSAAIDTTIASGIFIGKTLSVAGSVSCQYAFLQTLN